MSKALPIHRPGSSLIVQRVREGGEAAYREWSSKINKACSEFPGFWDLEVFEPVPGESDNFVLVIRFATAAELEAWHSSPTCQTLLKEKKHFLESEVRHAPSSVFGNWFSRSAQGSAREPSQPWKEALIVLLTLYPTVMLLTLYLTGPLMGEWPLSVSMYLGNLMTVSILTWVLMPLATRSLSFWLEPPKGSGVKNLLKGLFIVLGGQLMMVFLFYTFT